MGQGWRRMIARTWRCGFPVTRNGEAKRNGVHSSTRVERTVGTNKIFSQHRFSSHENSMMGQDGGISGIFDGRSTLSEIPADLLSPIARNAPIYGSRSKMRMPFSEW